MWMTRLNDVQCGRYHDCYCVNLVRTWYHQCCKNTSEYVITQTYKNLSVSKCVLRVAAVTPERAGR